MSNIGQSDIGNSLKEMLAKVSPMLKGISSKIPFIKNSRVALIGGGALVLLLVFFLFSGGGETKKAISFVEGQTYILNNPNQGKLVLMAVPSLASTAIYQGKETDDSGCLVLPDTPANYLEQTMVGYIHYVKVVPTEGKCEGRSGWTASVNVKEKTAGNN